MDNQLNYLRKEIHLGYLWEKPQAERVFRLARENPTTQFIGIDIGSLTRRNKPSNLEHKKLDFVSGLKLCKKGSADLIESVMAVGIYGRSLLYYKQSELLSYTKEILELAKLCLKPKGEIRIYLTPQNLMIEKAKPESLDYLVQKEEIYEFDSMWGKKTIANYSKMNCYVLTSIKS